MRSTGADAAGAGPVPVQMWAGAGPVPGHLEHDGPDVREQPRRVSRVLVRPLRELLVRLFRAFLAGSAHRY